MIEVSKDNLGALLVCSVRYAMGRQSYMVGLICDLVRKHIGAVDKNTINTISRDISTELERCERSGELLGAQMDHDEWSRLLGDITVDNN